MEQAQSTLSYQKQAIKSLGIPVPNTPNGLFPNGALSRYIHVIETNGGVQRLRQNYGSILENYAGNGTRIHSLANLHLATSFASLLGRDHYQSEIALANFWDLMELGSLVDYMRRNINGTLSSNPVAIDSNIKMVGRSNLENLKEAVTREMVKINGPAGKAWPYGSMGLMSIASAYELMRHPTDKRLRAEAMETLENGLWTTGYIDLLVRTLNRIDQNVHDSSKLEKTARNS